METQDSPIVFSKNGHVQYQTKIGIWNITWWTRVVVKEYHRYQQQYNE